MFLQTNTVKAELKRGGLVYGTSLADCLDPEMPLILAAAGLDFFFVDTEHSPAGYGQIRAICRSARAANVIPLVRITVNNSALISRALDVGAMGVIVPQIRSAAEARAAMDAMKFPPAGHRGYGLGSIITDLKSTSAPDEVISANKETLAVMMIESVEGVQAVDEIAGVPEVDALFIGPYDLSLALGILEQFDHPLFWEAVEKVITAGKKAGVAVGMQSARMPMLRRAKEMGARFLMYASDVSILLNGYRNGIAELKSV